MFQQRHHFHQREEICGLTHQMEHSTDMILPILFGYLKPIPQLQQQRQPPRHQPQLQVRQRVRQLVRLQRLLVPQPHYEHRRYTFSRFGW